MTSKQGKGKPPPAPRSVKVEDDTLTMHLDNGKTVTCSLRPFRTLMLAPERARRRVRIIGPGIGISWPDLGYDLGVEGLLRTCRPVRRRRAGRAG